MTSNMTQRRYKSRLAVPVLGLALGMSLLLAAACGSSTTDDPEPDEAATVTDFITTWIGERAGIDGIYHIPARGGHDVSGTMSAFHTVHQRDADTYYVCLDFHDRDNLYDVDFVVDQTDAGLALAEHYLHQVNGVDVGTP